MGYFCGSDGLSKPSGPCAPGFLCFVQATVPNPTDNSTGTMCPPGAYCLLGIRAGFYQYFKENLLQYDPFHKM